MQSDASNFKLATQPVLPRTAVVVPMRNGFAQLATTGHVYWVPRRQVPAKRHDVILIYATRPTSAIVGEARIKEVVTMYLDDLWRHTGDGSQLKESEFYAYFKGLEEGRALKLEAPYAYQHPVPLSTLGKPRKSFRYWYVDILGLPGDVPTRAGWGVKI